MLKNCKCNPKKTNNEFCDHCGKQRNECVCDNAEINNLDNYLEGCDRED